MLAARLQHPHIVPCSTLAKRAASSLCHGASRGSGLGELIAAQLGAPPVADRDGLLQRGARVLAKAAKALVAHKRGIVHRDIKPDNILVDADDEPHTDFGIAKGVQREIPINRPGAIIGTPAYMAPEQATACRTASARRPTSTRSARPHHLACGRPPFEDASPLKVLLDVMERSPNPRAPSPRRRSAATAIPSWQ